MFTDDELNAELARRREVAGRWWSCRPCAGRLAHELGTVTAPNPRRPGPECPSCGRPMRDLAWLPTVAASEPLDGRTRRTSGPQITLTGPPGRSGTNDAGTANDGRHGRPDASPEDDGRDLFDTLHTLNLGGD